jgi:hypothetical protein
MVPKKQSLPILPVEGPVPNDTSREVYGPDLSSRNGSYDSSHAFTAEKVNRRNSMTHSLSHKIEIMFSPCMKKEDIKLMFQLLEMDRNFMN